MLESNAANRAAKLVRARKGIGAFESGLADVSERHDAYLADAFRGDETLGDAHAQDATS